MKNYSQFSVGKHTAIGNATVVQHFRKIHYNFISANVTCNSCGPLQQTVIKLIVDSSDTYNYIAHSALTNVNHIT